MNRVLNRVLKLAEYNAELTRLLVRKEASIKKSAHLFVTSNLEDYYREMANYYGILSQIERKNRLIKNLEEEI